MASKMERLRQTFEAMDDKQLRKEYARIRKTVNKRLARMGASEFVRSRTYQEYVNAFRPMSEHKTHADLAAAMTDLYMFYSDKKSTLRGQKEIRKKSIESLHKSHYDFVNEQNWFDWVDMMEWWNANTPSSYGSPKDEVMTSYLDARKNNMSAEQAEMLLLEYIDTLEPVTKARQKAMRKLVREQRKKRNIPKPRRK